MFANMYLHPFIIGHFVCVLQAQVKTCCIFRNVWVQGTYLYTKYRGVHPPVHRVPIPTQSYPWEHQKKYACNLCYIVVSLIVGKCTYIRQQTYDCTTHGRTTKLPIKDASFVQVELTKLLISSAIQNVNVFIKLLQQCSVCTCMLFGVENFI